MAFVFTAKERVPTHVSIVSESDSGVFEFIFGAEGWEYYSGLGCVTWEEVSGCFQEEERVAKWRLSYTMLYVLRVMFALK